MSSIDRHRVTRPEPVSGPLAEKPILDQRRCLRDIRIDATR